MRYDGLDEFVFLQNWPWSFIFFCFSSGKVWWLQARTCRQAEPASSNIYWAKRCPNLKPCRCWTLWTLCSSNWVKTSQGNSTNVNELHVSCTWDTFILWEPPVRFRCQSHDASVLSAWWTFPSPGQNQSQVASYQHNILKHQIFVYLEDLTDLKRWRFDRCEPVIFWKIPISWSEHSQQQAPHPTSQSQPWCVVSWVWAELCPQSFPFCGLLGCISDDS